jgi:hypothetical protein
MKRFPPATSKPGEFPLGSLESRAAARKLLECRHREDDWKTVTVVMDDLEEAKSLARLFANTGPNGSKGGVVLIDDNGKEILY